MEWELGGGNSRAVFPDPPGEIRELPVVSDRIAMDMFLESEFPSLDYDSTPAL